MILFIIATASSFSWLFTYSDMSDAMVSGIVALNMSPKLFCVLIAVLLLFFWHLPGRNGNLCIVGTGVMAGGNVHGAHGN